MLHFLYKILPCSVLTYISVRGENALFASVVLYILCTALVNFTLQLPQLAGVYFQLQCPAGLASGPGRTAVPTSTKPMHQHHSHLFGNFHSHHLKGSNTGSISEKGCEETPQASHHYRPYLTNCQQRQHSLTQPMFVFREGCRCKERK